MLTEDGSGPLFKGDGPYHPSARLNRVVSGFSPIRYR
jgi:hypothetical protein